MSHKIGLIGYGHMGKNHARVINKNENAELVGIYDEKSENIVKYNITVEIPSLKRHDFTHV